MRHTVQAYDQELNHLQAILTQMGGLAEQELAKAIEALSARDPEAAALVIAMDKKLDALELEADDHVIQMIARRSPVADDLRDIVSALKIASMLERIGDFAKNIAKRVTVISEAAPVKPALTIPRMAQEAQTMVREVLEAYVERDTAKAVKVWRSDDRVDALYNSLFRELLTYMMESPSSITQSTHLLFIAKNIERIGDQATNIAEVIYFAVEGKALEDTRPKGDMTSFASVGDSESPSAVADPEHSKDSPQ
ncbi:phosphate transport system regulatory protein PhoU [Iodidimonas muriae]|uniref:Phosphate-specific transport system accessory protein PhoU n=1 Tax=Iodidimonas muriae TaxID=261467 RepID=A0ABQ2LEU9_9PROT|nr:phosphate signaling complex protein PhoU [Iodidimonas muriae]GER07495.1 phosphate transport system regulatory protein PhoU [Kordiimonadales bacterium JCM 17843]GGO14255.1 phosphate transport system regulatory protein PhoU [Iodidimonas muriae]